MRHYTNSTILSESARTNTTHQGGGVYSEVHLPTARPEQHRILHLFPALAEEAAAVRHADMQNTSLLGTAASSQFSEFASHSAGISGTTTASDGGGRRAVGSFAQDFIHGCVCKNKWHDGAMDFVFKWRGLTEVQLEQGLLPVKIHYKLQLLMFEERRNRRAVVNEEFTHRVEMQIDCRYSAPLRESLLKLETLNTVSQKLRGVNRRPHPSSVSDFSNKHASSKTHSLEWDPHTPSTNANPCDGTPWTGDSQLTYLSPVCKEGTLSNSLAFSLTSMDTGCETTMAKQVRHECSTPRNTDAVSRDTIRTITRRLNSSSESLLKGRDYTPVKKDAGVEDSLALSVAGTLFGQDSDDDNNDDDDDYYYYENDSLARSIDIGDAVLDDALPEYSLHDETPPDFLNLGDGDVERK